MEQGLAPFRGLPDACPGERLTTKLVEVRFLIKIAAARPIVCFGEDRVDL